MASRDGSGGGWWGRRGLFSSLLRAWSRLRARFHLHLALRYYARGRFDEAARTFRKLLRLEPDDVGLRLYAAMLFRVVGRMDDAEAALREALEKDPGEVLVIGRLVEICEEQERWDEALQLLDAALPQVPDPSPLIVLRGRLLWRLGRSSEAVTELARHVAQRPSCHEAMVLVGEIFEDEGRIRKALTWYRRAHLAGGHDPLVLYRLGMALLRSGRGSEGERFFRKGRDLRPDLAIFPVRIGDCLRESERWDEAIASYDEALRLDPEAQMPRVLDQAHCHVQLERYEEAARCLERWLEVDGADKPDVRLGLGQLYSWMGRPDRAIRELEKVTRSDPTNEEARFMLAVLRQQGGEGA